MIAGRKRRPARSARIASAVALVALALPAAANADDPPAPGAATTQYRESLPGATGPILTGSTTGPRARLAPAVAQRLSAEAGPDADLLKEVATSPDYGAPPTAGRGPRGEPRNSSTAEHAEEASNAFSSAARALSHGSWRTLGLGAFMLVTAASLLAAQARRRQPPAAPQG